MTEQRLIDANALVADTYEAQEFSPRTKVIKLSDVIDAPTVDAVPVVHARWFNPDGREKSYIRICTNCKKAAYNCNRDKEYHYCPNCGAKMDADEGAEG